MASAEVDHHAFEHTHAGKRLIARYIRDHPFKTSACLRGGGVKNWPNLPTDSSKKLPTEGG